MPLIEVWVNPLKWMEIDSAGLIDSDRTLGGLFEYLTSPDAEPGFDALVARYRKISAVRQDPLFVAPMERNILQKLVWPLRHAKGSYALGDYLGCIGLCGLVGEMVGILVWEISKPLLHGGPLYNDAKRLLRGQSFENLGQKRRIQILEELGLIKQESVKAFQDLRQIRRRYLHFFSKDHARAANDARKAYEYALIVVAAVLGQTVTDGRIQLRPDLMEYLREHGVVDAGEPENPGGA